jgi:cell division protein FtsZ
LAAPLGASATRSYIDESATEEVKPQVRTTKAREGGTLFERMSSLARGAAKAQVEEEEPRAPRDPLDIPRFLNRQNNQ